MEIYPIMCGEEIVCYQSSPVYINYKGRRVFVSPGYVGDTVAEVLHLAQLNAKVKQWRLELCEHMAVERKMKEVGREIKCLAPLA